MSKVIDYFFLSHPRENGMTYLQHLGRALSFSFEMIKGGTALLIHGLIPTLFEKTGSDTIAKLHKRLEQLHKRLEQLHKEAVN